ncbi:MULTISPECIES: amidohydrolase [Clostridium]|uniref:Imidazolonepropionase n=2 Tax=Clostridium TaxID=1485 RepID=D8GPH3_CLOLD|nr:MULTISPECIES: amidohydrolase [Clostridium]ADK16051.1 predicted amidohydrolase [Clostridium ljungdahlii DSM 13528]AGY75227.1 amidohydrolase [Clostridium autoethanogenum DSM 10061]ALU35397.1 putative amidohydrolase [Clostridium autoethanogenum DSM 10061]OAA87073.1 Imidazolonepropionase [Clostridium ljungdahlii DSM 13528]OVY49524.1 Imidazolonepropionase [Clostridium autoethanogenum]
MNPILLKNCLLTNYHDYSKFTKDILITHGKIQQIADTIDFQCENLKTIDVKEQYVLPGFVDCHTHIGIIEEATGKLGLDNNETSNPVTPHLRAIDAINPLDIAFKDAVKAGVTCVMSGPGSNNPVGGLNTVLKTHGNIIDNMIVKDPYGLKIAFGEDPMCCYGNKGNCPVTRMAVAALIRELFMRAQDYMEQKEQGKIKERNIRLEAVIPLLKGDMFLRAHAHRADDIITAIRIAEEFNIKKLVIEHGTEAHLVSDYLKEKNIPVAFGPMLTPRIKMELRKRNYSSALHLVEAGIKVALMTDHPYNSIDQLRPVALLAVSEGLKPLDALKSITTNAAEILGCDNRIGKIKTGYDADIIILNGDPLDMVNTKVVKTIINGEIVFERTISN